MSRDEAPNCPGNKKRASGGSVTSASEKQAWRKLYKSTEKEWGKHFKGMDGKPLRALHDSQHPWYAGSAGDIRASSSIAYMVAVRIHQVVRCLCNFVAPNQNSTKAEVTSHIWLIIRCIQSCNINHRARVIQHDRHDPPSSEHSDEGPAEHSAAETPQKETQQQVETPDKQIATDPGHTSEDASPAHVSGSRGSLQGPGGSGEERRFKLDGRDLVADMTIKCQEIALAASGERLSDDAGKNWIVIAPVEVKTSSLTLRDIRQSFCQGIAAALRGRIAGSKHRTRSLLINLYSMIIMEYDLDDSYIKTVIDSGLAAADIPTNEIKGKYAIIYSGPFDFSLSNAIAREIFVGLVAPSFRSRIDRAQLSANLASMLRVGTIGSLRDCLGIGFDVPPAFLPIAALPADDDTTTADALCMACLSGKYPETSEEKENKKRKREESKDDVATNL